MPNSCKLLHPSWPAPIQVKACTTLRQEGFSLPPFEHFNLAEHTGDDPVSVSKNRALLKTVVHLPSDPIWLTQVHGTTVVDCNSVSSVPIEADASVAFKPNQVCAVLTADCLPVLLCDTAGTCVGAVHAGWRGLSQGVIEATVKKLKCDPSTLLAWFGPAIGPKSFEVGEEVLSAFTLPEDKTAFQAHPNRKWRADIYHLAKNRLQRVGVTQIFGGGFCTYLETDRFYSFRRSNQTGRMATLIWLTA